MIGNTLVISIIVLTFGVLGFAIYNNQSRSEDEVDSTVADSNMNQFVSCLAENEVVAYTSETCPACFRFAQQFGGYEFIEPINVECSENPDECQQNMQTGYVPEVHIDGQVLETPPTPEDLSAATGCKLASVEQ